MAIIRIVGDVHGKTDIFENVIGNAEYSLQVGDFGFRNAWMWMKANYNPDNHKILHGKQQE